MTKIPEGKWVVTAIAIGGELQPPLPGFKEAPLTLEVEGDRVAGSSGVNRFMGPVNVGGKIFGNLAMTMMAGPEELMAQEQIFMGHLGATDSVELSDSGMLLIAEALIVVELEPAGTE